MTSKRQKQKGVAGGLVGLANVAGNGTAGVAAGGLAPHNKHNP